MTVREWFGATWAEWRPTLEDGRFEVGPCIFMTRGAMRDVFRSGEEHGRRTADPRHLRAL